MTELISETSSQLCWQCNVREVEEKSEDITYRLECNDCFRHRKNEWMQNWMNDRRRKLACWFCWDAFWHKKKVVIHKCPRYGTYQCGTCAYQLHSRESLKVHIKVAHGDLNTKDSGKVALTYSLPATQANSSQRRFHMIRHYETVPLFQGNHCSREQYFKTEFPIATNLRSSELTAVFPTEKMSHVCKLCKKTFTRIVHLNKHTLSDHLDC